MSHSDHVTDHAVIRYLERVYGFDTSFFRDRIAKLTATAISQGASGVTIDGVKFVIRDGRVVTVLEKDMRSRDLRTGR